MKRRRRQNLVMDLIIKYADVFTDAERNYLINNCTLSYKDKLIPDLLREVYDKLDLIEDEENIYLGFIDLLDSEFDIKEKEIIEVGGGIFPQLAKKISKYQTKGQIKVYDPRLSYYEDNTSKMTLVREKFTANTKVEDVDLLIGFMPCEATYTIIDSATRNNIDFMIALCEGGPHGDIYDYFETEDEWLHSIMSFASSSVEYNKMGTVEKTYLKKYHNPYPIIYNKR